MVELIKSVATEEIGNKDSDESVEFVPSIAVAELIGSIEEDKEVKISEERVVLETDDSTDVAPGAIVSANIVVVGSMVEAVEFEKSMEVVGSSIGEEVFAMIEEVSRMGDSLEGVVVVLRAVVVVPLEPASTGRISIAN